MKERELTELFRRLGARHPEASAHSQLTENLPQLARFLFLKQAWKQIVSDGDPRWISDRIRDDPQGPGGAITSALARLRGQGASEADLTTVVRVMQWRLLASLCRLLDDPGELEPEVKDIAWRLFQVDEDNQPIAVLAGFLESVLDTDPSGREMRPK